MTVSADLRCVRVLDAVHPDGTRTMVRIFIGQPYQISDSTCHRCPVRIEGLDYFHDFPDIGGWDTMQSIQLAMLFAEGMLQDYTIRGGRLFYPGTDELYGESV